MSKPLILNDFEKKVQKSSKSLIYKDIVCEEVIDLRKWACGNTFTKHVKNKFTVVACRKYYFLGIFAMTK